MLCGGGCTASVPIYENQRLPHAISKQELGGKDVSEYLEKLINQKQFLTFDSLNEKILLDEMKESFCYSSTDYEEDKNLSSQTTELESCYELPDGRVINLNEERYKATELLFNPLLSNLNCSENFFFFACFFFKLSIL